ncbi:MAG: hypothetical protein R2713_15615 [Ilumatobacteraceae bacterium]
MQHSDDCASMTLYPQANSWYMGANVPGKPRVFLPYIGGVGTYRVACDEVVERDFLGFRLGGADGETCNDGVVRRVMPDVQMVLDLMASLELPPIESMSPELARRSSWPRRRRRARPDPRSARWSTAPSPGPTAIRSSTACTDRPPRARIRSSSTSTVAAGCSATTRATTPSAATCACARTP